MLDIKDGIVVGGREPLDAARDRLEVLERPDPRQGRPGPKPDRMSVLTSGVQVVEVAVDVETGEVRVERVAAATTSAGSSTR